MAKGTDEYIAELGLVQEFSRKWRADLHGFPLELSAKGDTPDGAHEALRAEFWNVLSRVNDDPGNRVETVKSYDGAKFFLRMELPHSTGRKLAAYIEENATSAQSA